MEIAVIGSDTEVAAYVFGSETLFSSHQSLVELLAMTCTNDIRTRVSEELLHPLGKIADCSSISLLDKQVSRVSVIEREMNQFNCFIQIH